MLFPCASFAQGLDSFAAEDEPVATVDAVYIGDVWRNEQGGLRTGTAYLGNAEVAVAIDGERLLGIEGTSFYLDVQSIHGQSVSSRLVGDAQGVSNIEADNQLRLYELWVERRFARHAGPSLRFGLYDLNSEFDVLETAGLFLNGASGVGPQLAQTGLNGPSIFPVTSLGMRLQWSFAPKWSGRFALMDAVPGDPEHPTSHRMHFGNGEGVLAATEVARAGDRLTKVAVGAWTYTARFEEIAEIPENGPQRRRWGNRGVYAIAEGRVYVEPENPGQGLNAFVRAGTADERFNRFADFLGAGVVYTGAFPGRDEDQIGLAVASVGNGDVYRKTFAGLAPDSRETTVELTYRSAVTEWLTLQASLQHVSNPDTDPGLRDAMAFGLRFELSKGWSWPPSSRHRFRL